MRAPTTLVALQTLLQRRGLGDQVVARACGLWALGNKGRAPLELSQSHVTCMALACTDGAENVGALCCCLLVKINSLWGLL